MTFLVWQRDDPIAIASPRRVFRATEVPLLADAQALCARLAKMHTDTAASIAAAADAAREAARADGFASGQREGREQLAATLTTLATEGSRAREALRDSVAALALEVVRKIAGGLAPEDVLARLAASAARDVLGAESLALVVHPDRRADVAAKLATDLPGLRCDVRDDPGLPVDSCVLETEHGAVDASLEAQLDRLAAAWGIER